MLTEVVIPYVKNGVVTTKWGKSARAYQVIELRIYKTEAPHYKKEGTVLDELLTGKRNVFKGFEAQAKKALQPPAHRVFAVMPIQGERFGSQDEQRLFREYDERFEVIENTLSNFGCVSIRIDKEHPLQDIVGKIKDEIQRAQFVVADLTDERPSCYFEAGYAEALGIPVVYLASKESVIRPGQKTKIHFDIHMNVNFFSNHQELSEKLSAVVEKNKLQLLEERLGPREILSVFRDVFSKKNIKQEVRIPKRA